jgi:glutamyl-Q tRNA(Asp) synthetase
VSGASGNTAIGTTATAERARAAVVGRFAPSPNGPLHLGSLATALASFLDARNRGGRWLLRIEDIDLPRTVPGAADAMQRTLEALALHWDGPVAFQSQRLELYGAALQRLEAAGDLYSCTCTRRDLGGSGDGGGYPGTCRDAAVRPGPAALRFRVDRHPVAGFNDRLLGTVPAARCLVGDPVVRRRDGLHAYQLAVVVDDAGQGITDVVRGADLAASTPWQVALQQALGLPRPAYAHLPLVCEPDGSKLAKSRRSVSPSLADPAALAWELLVLLRQAPPPDLQGCPPAELWAWASAHWRLEALAGLDSIPAPAGTWTHEDLGAGARLY